MVHWREKRSEGQWDLLQKWQKVLQSSCVVLLPCLMLWPLVCICTFGQPKNVSKHTFDVKMCSWAFEEFITWKMDNYDEIQLQIRHLNVYTNSTKTLNLSTYVLGGYSPVTVNGETSSTLAVKPADESSPSRHQVGGQLSSCRPLTTLAKSSLSLREFRHPNSTLIWSWILPSRYKSFGCTKIPFKLF